MSVFEYLALKPPQTSKTCRKKINSQINVAVCVQKSTNFLIVDIKSFLTTDVKARPSLSHILCLPHSILNTLLPLPLPLTITFVAFLYGFCCFFLVIQHQFKAFPNTVIHTVCHFSQSTLILWLLVLRAIFSGSNAFFVF